MEITKATPQDVGCYVEGGWGHYGTAHLVQQAQVFGYDDAEVIALAARHLASMPPSGADPLSTDDYWLLVDMGGEVEQWLNENVAPEGYMFGWHDGEFHLQSEQWWEEEQW